MRELEARHISSAAIIMMRFFIAVTLLPSFTAEIMVEVNLLITMCKVSVSTTSSARAGRGGGMLAVALAVSAFVLRVDRGVVYSAIVFFFFFWQLSTYN